MRLLNPLVEINSLIDKYLAPSNGDREDIYRTILSGIDFTRGLHLGSGRDKRNLGTDLKERGEIIALDPDLSGLKRNNVGEKVHGDGERLPFRDESFDLVFSEYVFEHLPRPKLALREINRILKLGGSFVILVPNPRHYYARIAGWTPFWFHKFWFRLQGVDNPKQDRFPTQYNWGTFEDITGIKNWSLEELYSFPGPTGYTTILPIHFLFTLLAKIVSHNPRYHVCYLAHFIKRDKSKVAITDEMKD